MAKVNNRIYLLGGGSGSNWNNKYNDIYQWFPETSHWELLKTTGTLGVCTFPGVWVIDSFIFVFAGQKIESSEGNKGPLGKSL